MSPSEDLPAAPSHQALEPLDPIASLRAHPNWFFASGHFEWQTAVGLLIAEAYLSSRVGDAKVARVGDWVTVTADADWLNGDLEAFTKPTAFPEGGTNATRVEALLTAYCDAVVTASRGRRSDIRTLGEHLMPSPVVESLKNKDLGRVIVFRVPSKTDRRAQSSVPRTTERLARALAQLPDREREFQHA